MASVQENIFLGDCTAKSTLKRSYYIHSKKSQYPTLDDESSAIVESTSLQNSSYARNFVIEGPSMLGALLDYKNINRWRYGSLLTETYSSKHTPQLDSILTNLDLNKISKVLLDALSIITKQIVIQTPDLSEIKKEGYRKDEIEWLEQNKDELKKFTGKWICIEGKKLIASYRDMKKLMKFISERKIKKPFVYFIPNEPDSEFIGA